MKKLLITGLLLTTSCFIASQAFSGAFSNAGDPGGVVTVDGTNADGGDLDFKPSPQVLLYGATGESAYAMAAAHSATENKDEAKAYAMISSDSNMYWADYTALTVISGQTSSTALSTGGSWNSF